jgi:hypothetical protein
MFEKILRDLERLVEEFAGQPPKDTPSDLGGELKTMHFDGLKQASARATQLGYFKFERSVDQIRVGDSLTALFEKLVENTRNDGKERGRILRIDLGGTKVYVDPTTVGDEDSVTQSFRTTIYHEQKPYQAFSLIHTHPVSLITLPPDPCIDGPLRGKLVVGAKDSGDPERKRLCSEPRPRTAS